MHSDFAQGDQINYDIKQQLLRLLRESGVGKGMNSSGHTLSGLVIEGSSSPLGFTALTSLVWFPGGAPREQGFLGKALVEM